MRPRHRQAEIAELVCRSGGVSVDDLATKFHVSQETIRRDLGQLAEFGLVEKVHGGARRSRLLIEGTFQERMADNPAAKEKIAGKLLQLIGPGDTLFIDTGSTTLVCAQRLSAIPRLSVITNSTRIAHVLRSGAGRAEVHLVGGAYRADNGQTLGPIAIDQIRGFQADHAVISVTALDAAAGATDASIDEMHIARAMSERSSRIYVVADSSKFQCRAAYRVCELKDIDVLVSDRRPDPGLTAALESANVKLL
jgi:DeoR family glycerol-3-phosphate regulon repressor